ncbi:MAG TPA: sugar ABC transporter permease [Spirochaetales bacterium]|nr:sugar ABC transporter permease [Spirochaetales bacterium]HRY53913.1 sugar ABC transporter permease [Spirochaetia bacterium]HRZ65307.1 sugar ABC transporter permease [Spirochaetia bacterium]
MQGRLRPLGSERAWLWIMLAPTLAGIAFGTAGSLLASGVLSLTAWDLINPPSWAGLGNYARCLGDPKFLAAVRVTLRFAALYVPLCVALSLALALLLNRGLRGQGFFRAMFFAPSITSAVAIGLVFTWIYAKDEGLLNRLLQVLGLRPVNWLGEGAIFYAVTIANVWGALGEGMIVLLAGLKAVPATYYEAATIDGAGGARKFFRITLPLISPTIFFQVIIATVNGLQAFEYIYMLTRRSQGESTMATVVYLIYRNGFRWFSMGLASAQAMILAAVIVLLMLAYFRLEKRLVVYD